MEVLRRHLELELEPELEQHLGLELEVVVADWLVLATVEAIPESDVFDEAHQSRASCRDGPFEIHPRSHLGGHCTTF